MEAVLVGDGRIGFGASIGNALSSLLTISSGGSIGREGAMVQLAAMIGSRLGLLAARADSPPAAHGGLRRRRRHCRRLQRADLRCAVRRRDRARFDRHGELRAAGGRFRDLQRHDSPVPRLRAGVRRAAGPFALQLGAHLLCRARRVARASRAAVSGAAGFRQVVLCATAAAAVLAARCRRSHRGADLHIRAGGLGQWLQRRRHDPERAARGIVAAGSAGGQGGGNFRQRGLARRRRRVDADAVHRLRGGGAVRRSAAPAAADLHLGAGRLCAHRHGRLSLGHHARAVHLDPACCSR